LRLGAFVYVFNMQVTLQRKNDQSLQKQGFSCVFLATHTRNQSRTNTRAGPLRTHRVPGDSGMLQRANGRPLR
jgi:hypothetical protein